MALPPEVLSKLREKWAQDDKDYEDLLRADWFCNRNGWWYKRETLSSKGVRYAEAVQIMRAEEAK